MAAAAAAVQLSMPSAPRWLLAPCLPCWLPGWLPGVAAPPPGASDCFCCVKLAAVQLPDLTCRRSNMAHQRKAPGRAQVRRRSKAQRETQVGYKRRVRLVIEQRARGHLRAVRCLLLARWSPSSQRGGKRPLLLLNSPAQARTYESGILDGLHLTSMDDAADLCPPVGRCLARICSQAVYHQRYTRW